MIGVGEFERLVNAFDMGGPEGIEIGLLGSDDDEGPVSGAHSDGVAESDGGLFDAVGSGFASAVEEEDGRGGGFNFSGGVDDEVVAFDRVGDESGGHGVSVAYSILSQIGSESDAEKVF